VTPDKLISRQNDRLVLDAWLDRYAPSLELFVEEVLGATPEPWQLKVIRDYDAARTVNSGIRPEYFVRISIASGHGVGKTTLLAWIVIHHVATMYPQKTAVTAPSSNQLWDALWPEIKSWINRMPAELSDPDKGLFSLKAERIELRDDPAGSFVSAKAARQDQPEALAGVHSDFVLLILDEFSGVPDAVIESASGSMSGQRVAMIGAGNPLRGQGYFYDTHHKLAGDWLTYTVSVFDSKYSSKDFAKMIETRYGKESNQYRVRVLGLFPLTDDDAVIPREWILASVDRDVKPPQTASISWGVDVASMGQHRTTLVKRKANIVTETPKAWGGFDDAQVTGRIKLEWDLTPKDDRPSDINVDCIGYGAAVARGLRDLGLPARCINVSETPSLKNSMYRNVRAELAFKARDWFQKRDSRLPAFDKDGRVADLVEELAAMIAKPQAISGKIILAEKKGHESPDIADAFMLSLASESITISEKGDNYRNWKKPLLNPIKGIV
jgi:phage terminase large subunit